ncbi:VOC family protein [Kineosporia sp. J2-2]|uniref:VOC family protein n=1 Tax=Kineosporia corallincola TaxID=2835133 RepID=A0ABS5TSQ8_9ACTN|nr:VOC family protein [Kineosporia corallincola]MBT0773835.1 VOC family protein [Kineosporia corallincola]
MPFRENAPSGAPVWFDLSSSDPERMRDFYAAVFGWTYEVTGEEFDNYVMFRHRGHDVAGMMGKPAPEMPDAWNIYLSSDDVNETVRRAEKAGGSVILQPMDVGTIGSMAFVQDTSGAFLGVWQPKTHRGTQIWGEAGAPYWVEMHATDYPAATSFYRDVFDWQIQVTGDSDDFRYCLQIVDGEQLAGIMDATFLPPGVPANWHFYLGCEDVDATLAAVEKHGGTVNMPPEETPFGRLAGVADPGGAGFMLTSLSDWKSRS